MKMLILLLLAVFCNAASINTENIGMEARKKVLLESILENDMVPIETEISAENSTGILAPFNISSQCESYSDLSCPAAAKGDLIIRRHNADLKTGKVNCLVYTSKNIDRAFQNFTYTNPACKARWTPDVASVETSAYLQNVASKMAAEKSALDAAKSEASSRAAALNDQQLNLSDLLIAVMTLDGEKIDLVQSIAAGSIKLQPGYTALTENTANASAPLSDLATDSLNSKTVAIFEFMSKITDIVNTTTFILILLFVVAYFLKSGVIVRIFHKQERENKGPEALLWIIALVSAILLFLVPAVDFSINSTQRFQQSKFHQFLQFFFESGGKLGNSVNVKVHDAVFSALLKERGFKSTEALYQTAAEQKVLEQFVAKTQAEYTRCTEIYDVDKIKEYVGTSGKFIFPLTEKELHMKEVLNIPNVVSSPYFDFLSNLSHIPSNSVTFSQCGQIERAYREGQFKLNQNLQFLRSGSSEEEVQAREHVLSVVKAQYKAISDWGFLSAAFLPASLAELELESAKNTQQAANNDKDFIDKVAYNIPYLMFPGTGTIISTVTNLTPGADGIPFLSSIFKGLGAAIGAAMAIMTVQIALSIAPLLIMTIVSLVIGITLFYQIIAYFISGFFAVLLAIWSNSTENIFGFFGRGIRLFAKIVAFPISVFFGLEAYWITTSIGTYLSSRFAQTAGDAIVSSFAYQLFGGTLHIAMTLIAMFLSFKIVGKFVDLILENLSFGKSDTLDEQLQQIMQSIRQIKKV
ncbi:hypothetical protein [Sulfurospirillum sp. MES]|uniref:hypothetical protein n=1 Tax=Sulfurospirillum sp. MES TaxID=1565314 RepID=UPI0005420434|nr:hypothetical protein [Sulfurospirillum sp. MES]KHG32990.1 MAG: hypothetical protein OA34_12385 [Sulfurospirillum sp. MES]